MENKLEKPLGITDALFGGFQIVVSRPWVLLIPIALDLFLWLGPLLTAAPVFQQFIALIGTAQPPNATPEVMQGLDAAKKAWLAAGNKFNVFSILALVAIGMPTLMGYDAPAASFIRSRPAAVSISNIAGLAEFGVLLIVLGIFLGSIYLEALARGVRRENGGARTFAPRVLKSYLTTAALILFALSAAFIAMLPFLLSAALVGLFDPNIASFLFLLGLMLVMWAALYLVFAVPAIFVSGANLWQAVVSSVAVFRYNFWSALGLIFLIYLIDVGFMIVWQLFFASALGVLAADIANAFLGSALIAGAMLFYQDRITWLNRVRDQIRQQQKLS